MTNVLDIVNNELKFSLNGRMVHALTIVMSCHVMSCHIILCYIKNVSIRITLLTVGLTVVVGSEKNKTNYLIVTNKKL